MNTTEISLIVLVVLIILVVIFVFVYVEYFNNPSSPVSTSTSSNSNNNNNINNNTSTNNNATVNTAKVPGMVTGITVSNVTSFGCIVSWTPTATATSYQWAIKPTPGNSAIGASGSTNGTTVTVNSLDANFQYNVIVQAVNAQGVGPVNSPPVIFTTLLVQSSNQ